MSQNCHSSCLHVGLSATQPQTQGASRKSWYATPGAALRPELTVGTCRIGNVSPLFLPYSSRLFSGCILTVCLHLGFEAVMWLLLSGDFAKNSQDPPAGTGQRNVKVPARDSFPVDSYVAHKPWVSVLATQLSCLAVNHCWPLLLNGIQGKCH